MPLIEKNHHRLVAIGEIGLDFTPFWCKTEADKDGQRRVLKAQVDFQTIISKDKRTKFLQSFQIMNLTFKVELAKKFDLPL